MAQLAVATEHAEHTAAPVLVLYCPGGQSLQPRVALPPTWNLPASHALHTPPEVACPYPSTHVWQVLLPSR